MNFLSFSIWFWISIIEFATILVLIIKLLKKNKNVFFNDIPHDKLKKAKKKKIDMNNLINSINNSGILYKELSKKCHPDQFINSEKHMIAQEIFKEISKNKRNYDELNRLKERAIKELNINFN